MGAKKFVLHGSERHVLELGDLLVAQAPKVSQEDELAVLGSELIDRPLERGRKLDILQVTEWVLGLIFHDDLDLVAVMVGSIQRHRFELPPAMMVDPEVVTDSKQPCRKTVLRIEPVERVPGPNKGLLAELPRELDISDELAEKRSQSALVSPNQKGERVLVAIESKPHELFVGGVIKGHSVVMIQAPVLRVARRSQLRAAANGLDSSRR